MISAINNRCFWVLWSCDCYVSERLLGTCTHLCEQHVCLPLWCQVSKCFFIYNIPPFKRANKLRSFMCIHVGVGFHETSTFCLWWWLLHNLSWETVECLSGNWRWHIEFQKETRRGAALLAAEEHAGKLETVFQEKRVAANPACPFDFSTNIDLIPQRL